jgi:8-oxo-dGTP pyrophosphatase MutT (NUDIX family)
MNRTIPAPAQNDSIWRPDVTVACIVPHAGKFLLVEEDVRGMRVLNQPAGHLEPDESLPAAALRETREETGWDISLTHLVGIYQWANADGSFLRFTFAAEPVRHDPARPLDAGIVRAVWMTHDEIAASRNLRSPMVLRGVEDFIAGRSAPLDCIACLLAAS